MKKLFTFVALIFVIGCSNSITPVNPIDTTISVTFEGGTFGGDVWTPKKYIDSILPNQIKTIDVAKGDTIVLVSRNEHEAESFIAVHDTTLYFNDVVNYLAFFRK